MQLLIMWHLRLMIWSNLQGRLIILILISHIPLWLLFDVYKYSLFPRTVRDWNSLDTLLTSCLGGAVIGSRTRDRKIASSTPGRGAIKSTRLTQPSIPPG